MQNKLPELSIFFPFWNEEKNIEKVVENAVSVAKTIANKFEIIIVDDGSIDKTLDKAKKLEAKYPSIRTISHQPNRGYGAALKSGFRAAKYKYVVFTDGDMQFDFSEVTKFIEPIQQADLVIGYRKKREDKLVRHILMNLLKIWDFIFFRFYFKDIDCGFKMFRKEALEQIMPLRSEGAMISTEILAKSKAKKLHIVEVGVNHYPRKYGTPTGSNIPVIVRAMLESFILYWDIKNGRF